MLHLQRTPDVGRHRRKECGALAAADFQPFFPHLHKVVLHALDVAQVDEVALVAAGKMIGCKLFFRFQQTAPHRPDFVGGVVVQQAVAGLQVENIVGVQLLCAARCLQRDLAAAPPLDALQRPRQLCAELVVVDRLQYEVQRVDLVPTDGVLRHIRNEDQHDVGVKQTDAFRRGHAA